MKKVFIFVLLIFAGFSLTAFALTNNDYSNYYEDLFIGDWNKPGLYEKDGSVHETPQDFVSTGNIINVMNYGAKIDDLEFDNVEAFKKAIDAAKSNDTVYIPNGTYYFKSNLGKNGSYLPHILISKSNLTLKGESKDGVRLISECDPELYNSDVKDQTTVIAVLNKTNVVIRDLTISSTETKLPDKNDSKNNISETFAPRNGIAIDGSNKDYITSSIVVDNIVVERFYRMGVRIVRSRDVVVKNSTFKEAVALGSGGAGYGVCIQSSNATSIHTDENQDTLFNVVTNNRFIGPYIRHGVLIQYHAHNNLVNNNYFEDNLLDAIDLHGEAEFSNEISYNTIKNTRAGAGVGVGNTGGTGTTHGASGRNNLIYRNVIEGGLRGIDVIEGSSNTVLLENEIKSLSSNDSIGIHIKDGPKTLVLGNKFTNIIGDNAVGIRVDAVSYNDSNLVIVGNEVDNVVRGIYIRGQNDGLECSNNSFKGTTFYNIYNEVSKNIDMNSVDLKYQLSDNKEAIRLVGAISNFTDEEIRNAKIILVLTLGDVKEEIELKKVYRSVKDTYSETSGKYYAVLVINDLSAESTAKKHEFQAQIYVTINGVTYISNIIKTDIYIEK